jgi:3-oxoacyl-[acyl-carrier-protein] synthase II
MAKRRVVVTGLGIVSPVGNGIKEAWDNLLQGKSGSVPSRSSTPGSSLPASRPR